MCAAIATAEFLISTDTVSTTADLSADQSVFGHSCHGWTAVSDGQHVFIQHHQGQEYTELQWEQHSHQPAATTSGISHLSWADLQAGDWNILAITTSTCLHVCQLRLPDPAVAHHASAKIEAIKSYCFQSKAAIKAIAWHPRLSNVLAVATEEDVTVLQVHLKLDFESPAADDNTSLSFDVLAVIPSKQKARRGTTSLLWHPVNCQYCNDSESCPFSHQGQHSQQFSEKQQRLSHGSTGRTAWLHTMLVICWGGTAMEYITSSGLRPTAPSTCSDIIEWDILQRHTITACNDYLSNHTVRAMTSLPGGGGFLLSCDANLLSHTSAIIKGADSLNFKTNLGLGETVETSSASGRQQVLDLTGKIGSVQVTKSQPTQQSAASSTAAQSYSMPIQALLNGQLGLTMEATASDAPDNSSLAALLTIAESNKPSIPQSLQLSRLQSAMPAAGTLLMLSVMAQPDNSSSTFSADSGASQRPLQVKVRGVLPLHVPYANLLALVPFQIPDTMSNSNNLRTAQHGAVIAVGSSTTPAFLQIVKADGLNGNLQHQSMINVARPAVSLQIASEQPKQQLLCDPAKLRNRGIQLAWEHNDRSSLSKVNSSRVSNNNAAGYHLVVTAFQGEVIVSDKAPPPFTLLRKKGPVTTKLQRLQLSSFAIPRECIPNIHSVTYEGHSAEPLLERKQQHADSVTDERDSQAYASKPKQKLGAGVGALHANGTESLRNTGVVPVPNQAVDLQLVMMQLQQMQIQMNTWQHAMSNRMDRLERTLQSVVSLLETHFNTANAAR